jgi:OOP family OmpA-OmpF porin
MKFIRKKQKCLSKVRNHTKEGLMIAKKANWLSAILVFLVLASGCATREGLRQPPKFQVEPLAKEMWQMKTENLVFVLDASSSMAESYNGEEKFTIGRDVVAHFNQTMPDLPFKTALRSFGHADAFSDKSTVLTYGLTDYSRAGLAGALAKIIPAGGPSPMEKSFRAVADDLKTAQGKIAMVVISDGKDMDKAPLEAAKELKALYGDRLCIYTVLVGDDAAGRALLSAITQVTGCWNPLSAGDLASGPAMADFVATVLLKKVEVALPAMSKAGTWVFKDIKFEIDKDVLIASSYPTLEEIVKILTAHPDISVEIQGHTDSTASEAHNLDLSKRRAKTVMHYLKSKGIAASRMTAKGYGESRPMDTNDTARGRSNNRRVELKPLK